MDTTWNRLSRENQPKIPQPEKDIPTMATPNSAITAPAIRVTTTWFCRRNRETEVAPAPWATKMRVKPTTNKREARSTLEVDATPLWRSATEYPDTIARYPGRSGSTQGEMKARRPPPNATASCSARAHVQEIHLSASHALTAVGKSIAFNRDFTVGNCLKP